MKKITILISLLMCFAVSACQQKQVNTLPYVNNKGNFCLLYSETTRNVMTAHQLGMPFKTIKAKTMSNKKLGTTSDKLIEFVIVDAYSHPIYKSTAGKTKAINTFANKHLNLCKSSLKSNR